MPHSSDGHQSCCQDEPALAQPDQDRLQAAGAAWAHCCSPNACASQRAASLRCRRASTAARAASTRTVAASSAAAHAAARSRSAPACAAASSASSGPRDSPRASSSSLHGCVPACFPAFTHSVICAKARPPLRACNLHAWRRLMQAPAPQACRPPLHAAPAFPLSLCRGVVSASTWVPTTPRHAAGTSGPQGRASA